MSEWGEQMWSLWNTKVISSASSSWIISRQSSSVLPCYLFISAIKQTQETACRYLSVNTIKCWILNICHATITIAVTVDFVKMKVITSIIESSKFINLYQQNTIWNPLGIELQFQDILCLSQTFVKESKTKQYN